MKPVARVLWLILFANWAVAALKFGWGLVTNSTAMTADGLHSFIDGSSNIIGIVALRYAAQPADEGHPYGHQKFETLASLAIGVMIGVGVLELGRMAFDAIFRDVHATVTVESFAVMLGTLAVNLGVTRYEAREGRRLKSQLLLADSAHTLSDVYVTLAVLASLVLTRLGVPRADGFIALGVLVVVAYTGWKIIRQAVGVLADSVRVVQRHRRAPHRRRSREDAARALSGAPGGAGARGAVTGLNGTVSTPAARRAPT